jgi:cysteinyl-tRNA synthetase
MSLRLYNTLTQKLETFEPMTPGIAKMYVCGVTPYDISHAGHARVYTVFDVLARHLEARGHRVTYTRNITDVDDKILNRAKENGEDPLKLSARMWEGTAAELRAIGCEKPDHEPKVSTHIPEIIELIASIIAAGHAYVVKTPKGQDVYFEVRSFPQYGKLSHRNIDDLLAGARVDANDLKKDPLDFALWKGCEETEWGWPSPWGQGRPGWHIECSAMAKKYLGEHFDIHCGGMDLIFPHHENEVAQSECVFGPEFAKYWLHNGFLSVDSEKMSKSLGNFVTIRDVITRNDPEAFRYYLLGTHYRGPLAFEVDKLENGRVVFPVVDEAERRVDYLYNTRDALVAAAAGAEAKVGNVLQGQGKIIEEASVKVLAALDKDLNTPQALAVIAELAKASNEIVVQIGKMKNQKPVQDEARKLAAAAVNALDGCVKVLGLMQASSEEYAARTRKKRLAIKGLAESAVDAKVKARSDARDAKDWKRADELRAELTAMGIELLDGTGGSSWRVLV